MNDLTPLTGHDLTAWGHTPGPQFPALLARANDLLANGRSAEEIRGVLAEDLP